MDQSDHNMNFKNNDENMCSETNTVFNAGNLKPEV